MARATLANVESLRDRRTRTPEVTEVVTKQDSVDPRVSLDVVFVRSAVRKAMVRVRLGPLPVVVLVVDVVAKCLFPASRQIRFLALVPFRTPIVVERHDSRHAHGEHQLAALASALAAGAYYQVPNSGTLSNAGLTGGQGADPEERIRCKAVISGDDVGEQAHGRKREARQPQSWRTMSFGRRDCSSGPRHSLRRPSIASMMSFPRQPTRASP